MDVSEKKMYPPQSSISTAFSIFSPSILGAPPIFENTHMIYMELTKDEPLGANSFIQQKMERWLLEKVAVKGWLYVSIEMSKIPYPVIQQVIQKALFKAYLK